MLGLDLLARALARMPPGQADALITGLRALVDHATEPDLSQGGNHDDGTSV